MAIINFLRVVNVLLLLMAVAVALFWETEGEQQKRQKRHMIILLLFLFCCSLAAWGLVFLPPERVGVVISPFYPGGIAPFPLGPGGLHWVKPFFERVQTYPISRETVTMGQASEKGPAPDAGPVEALTQGNQRIFIDATVIYEIDPYQVVTIHQKWQRRYKDELIIPEAREAIRNVVSQYLVDEVASTKRQEIINQIAEQLQKDLRDNGLSLVDFVLRDISFTPEYAQSIEQKQIAEQQALQAKFVVEQKRYEAEQARQVAQGQADAAVIQAKGEAEARLIRARAEAEALKQIAEALATNPNLLTYEYISKISPAVRVILVPSNAPFILPLPDLGMEAPTAR